MAKMIRIGRGASCMLIVLAIAGCSTFRPIERQQVRATQIIESIRAEVAPDPHLAIYALGVEHRGSSLVLTGEVQSAEAKLRTLRELAHAGLHAHDQTQLLPSSELEDKTWAIAALSLCNGREGTEHKAELGTQLLMGDVVRVYKPSSANALRWLLAQSKDGYLAWQAAGNLIRCTEQEARAWETGPLVIVTAFDSVVFSQPTRSSEPLCDAVLLNRMKLLSWEDGWTRVQLPDGRSGFIATGDVQNYETWKDSRSPTPENIERTARLFLGRPYLWGANSPRGLDCSGFTKVVFASNGIELRRNASHQALQGEEVPLGSDFQHLRKGDLLFFGRKTADGRTRVFHTGIYLGNKEFIHSADRVHISSLDPNAPNLSKTYSNRLLSARRLLPQAGTRSTASP